MNKAVKKSDNVVLDRMLNSETDKFSVVLRQIFMFCLQKVSSRATNSITELSKYIF